MYKKETIVSVIITLLLTALRAYVELPALNIKSSRTWSFVIVSLLIYCVTDGLIMFFKYGRPEYALPFHKNREYGSPKKGQNTYNLAAIAVIILLAVWLIGFAASSKFFRAKSYSQLVQVEDGTDEDIPSVEEANSIALMDTSSAEMLGDREIGTLADLVSQFSVGKYTQINYNKEPVKVSALEYAGFFKWLNNRKKGVPGYVLVNPYAMEAEYRNAEEGMKYVPSAWFNENLYRVLWLRYPTLMFRNIHFELNEQGYSFYVAPYCDHMVGLFGGTQVAGVVVFDPATKESTRYTVDNIPKWVDVAVDGDLICERYNDSVQLHDGFLNSKFGQANCKMVTTDQEDDGLEYPDYGYVSKDDDVWIYTGVTSVTGDSSNLGFILANERTGKIKYIACAGANEFSAMHSAEGEVQEKGYRASFPSLVRIDERPSYIMVLKDANGLVKMYSAVNVSQYNLAATASSQDECINKYKMLVDGKITSDQANAATAIEAPVKPDTSSYEPKTVTIRKIETIVEGGDTYIYIVASDGNIYSAKYADVIEMIMYGEGDSLTIMTDGEKFTLPKKSEE